MDVSSMRREETSLPPILHLDPPKTESEKCSPTASSCDRPHGAEVVSGSQSFLNEGEETTGRSAGNDIEGNQHILAGADEVLIVGMEDTAISSRRPRRFAH